MKARPVIGYTTQNSSFDFLKWLTAVAIWLTGGRPVRLRPFRPRYEDKIDGLIIGGGTDVYPAHFKAELKPNYKYDIDRDALEMNWLKKAEQENLPVLGICRGAQLMNVSRGGTLHIDIAKVYENAKYPSSTLAQIFFRKNINITEGSLLEKLLKTKRLPVNSMHSQAVDIVGENLLISSQEDNGIVQSIEDPQKAFYIGVQFHPEALIYQKRFRNIFAALNEAARKK